MAILDWIPRINATPVIPVTPVISTSAYTSGDQVGGIMTIPNVIRQNSNMGFGSCELVSVTILDKAKQDIAMDIWIFKVSPTLVSSDNAPFDMTDANQATQCVGIVAVGSAYSDSVSNSTSSTVNLNLPINVAGTSATPSSFFAVAIVRGTPTYTSTSDLQFQFGIFVD